MKKILIIEDNLDILETTAEILELKGYKVLVAKNGIKGLELAITKRPNLIISDIMMPKMDGYEVLNKLRLDAKTAMIPFMFLTAKVQKRDMLQETVYKAERYLTKPFTMAELLKAVKETIELKAPSLLKKQVS